MPALQLSACSCSARRPSLIIDPVGQDAEREHAAEAGGAWDGDFVQAYEMERRRQERVYEARQRGGAGASAAPSEDPFAVRTVLHLRVLRFSNDTL